MMRYVLLAIALLIAVRVCRDSRQAIRIATFNIENFPKHERQVLGAFREIASTGAAIVAVQEITDPALFASAARTHLGGAWQFVSIETGSVLSHRLGVLYDSRAWTHVRTRVHDDTRLEGQHKPVLDVELRRGATHLRILVVHLKAGGENQPLRHRQHLALARVIARVERDGMPVVVAGDFNATADGDRADLARQPLGWVTETLACSAFWDRDVDCPRARLDHVLSTLPADDVRATGGCATAGCETGDSCPLYAADVSDHCPVVVELLR